MVILILWQPKATEITVLYRYGTVQYSTRYIGYKH